MLLVWIAIAIIIGLEEKISDSYKAYKYNQSGGFEARHPELYRKPYYSKTVEEHFKELENKK